MNLAAARRGNHQLGRFVVGQDSVDISLRRFFEVHPKTTPNLQEGCCAVA
jgi:hypothetical protein